MLPVGKQKGKGKLRNRDLCRTRGCFLDAHFLYSSVWGLEAQQQNLPANSSARLRGSAEQKKPQTRYNSNPNCRVSRQLKLAALKPDQLKLTIGPPLVANQPQSPSVGRIGPPHCYLSLPRGTWSIPEPRGARLRSEGQHGDFRASS